MPSTQTGITERELAKLDLNKHVERVVDDWNEPDEYTSEPSTIITLHALVLVVTPVEMVWQRGNIDEERTRCVIFGAYHEDQVKVLILDEDSADFLSQGEY